MALVTGKTMMDRNALPAVHDDATTGASSGALSDLARQGALRDSPASLPQLRHN
jgi:hypothetical protein